VQYLYADAEHTRSHYVGDDAAYQRYLHVRRMSDEEFDYRYRRSEIDGASPLGY
jgi:hypothetical protein